MIDHQRRDIQIPSGGMNKMIAADCNGISIPHDHYYLKLGLDYLDAGGKGESPSMGGMQSIKVHICRDPSRAPYSRDKNDFIFAIIIAVDCPYQRTEKNTYPAPWTPDMGKSL